ncbi:MAG: hypothetical protein R6U39_05275 [Candidatus Aegiribacteria sp.]
MFTAAALGALLLLLMPYIMMFSSGTAGIIGVTAREPAVAGDADPYHHAWHFWWVSRALSSGQDPRFCPAIYAPEGASLAYDHVGWLDALLFGALGTGGTRPELSHSLSLMFGTLLTGLFGYLLARSWGAGRYGALFTALALAWLPARTAHLMQHYQIANCWALPASLWAATLYIRRGGGAFLALFAAAILAAGMESPFISLFALLSAMGICLVRGSGLRRAGALALVWAAATALPAVMLLTAPGQTGSLSPDWREAVYWAAEPQSFLLPSPFGTAGSLLGVPMRFSWMPNAAEGVVAPGLTLLVLFGMYVWRTRGWKLLLVVVLFCLMALGPELKLLGRPSGIPLPFRAIQQLPLMGGVRAPSRFAIPAGVLVALGAGMVVSNMKDRWKRGVFALLILETALPSIPVLPTSVPSACLEVEAGTTVLELPVDGGVRRYSWFQARSSYSRRYSFMARLPALPSAEEMVSASPESGQTLMYHRWLYTPEEREIHDAALAPLFPGASPSDTVWVRGYPE